MTTPIHPFLSPQDGGGIWKQPNSETVETDPTERVTDDRRRDDMAGNYQVRDQSLLKSPRELANCLPAPPEVEALRIWLHSPKEHPVRWQLPMDGLLAKVRTGTEFSLDDSIADWVWQHQRPLIIAAEEETRFSDFVRLLLERGIKYFCAVPLMLSDLRIGVLGLASTSREALLSFDFKSVPCGMPTVTSASKNVGRHQPPAMSSQSEATCPENGAFSGNDFEGIIGRSPAMRALCKHVKVVASCGSAVLILGETGTGKELIARAIHNLSPRHDRSFIKVNCAAIPAGLIESELFGHERGAFTGAIERRTGRFEKAHGGTLFLDEVGDIPLELQPKLLRVLQEQEFERVGSSQTTRVDVRIVAATSRDLPQMVAAREFRPDLYYRLNVFPLRVPTLRERSEDIPPLVRHFVEFYCSKASKRVTEIPVETMDVLLRYQWPGNVRELQNVVERAVVLSPGKVLRPCLDEMQQSSQKSDPDGANKGDDLTTLKDVEREHIIRALAATNWVVGGPEGAAARLGLQRTTLIAKMQKLSITRAQA
jgi:formate hydrogenlyase transcriptional activator